ncbi:type II toxin-antitoxin system VapC family toxin [Rubrobacter indicoceani]|uniref:type II toxin-antitoxin system VapC family toxin n=1 Tax=Rubrobacter indicoceani TaxID=2051957 RepID=UPI0013C4F3BF|nr:type II toxin-antitoxin system VapC family toxin [Rubrobacter indicoceani]
MVQRRIVASEGDAHVRHVFDLEVMSVLRRIYFAGQFTEERADRALYRLETINITRHSHAPFLRRIREPRHNVTAYEAAYIALAETLDAPLVTLDGRLAGASELRVRVEVVG